MERESSFKVFRTKYVFGLVRPPIVIITRDVQNTGSASSEFHVLFSDRPETKSLRINAPKDWAQLPPEIMSLDLLAEESMEQAQDLVATYLYEDTPGEQRPVFEWPVLGEIEKNELLGLWVRGYFV